MSKEINVLNEYKRFCQNNSIPFEVEGSVKSYNDSTLFCPAGMQQYSNLFTKKWIKGTSANVQPCLRVNDLDEIGDGTHLLYFNMLGLFSFRELQMKNAFDLIISFLEDYLILKIDKITIHPDKIHDWIVYVPGCYNVETDRDCLWSDGKTKGYSIEFYVNGIEVANIVNTCGDCIDMGAGLERLEVLCGAKPKKVEQVLTEAIEKILETGATPSPNKQGYILRKLLGLAIKKKIPLENKYIEEEKSRIDKMNTFYKENKDKFKGKSEEWWQETHGVDIDLLSPLNKKE